MELVKFLKINDLDVLEQSFSELARLSERDQNLILKILKDWDSEQAIANILFYPRLIPEKQRYDVLNKALKAETAPYYMLAAVVGLQSLDRVRVNSAIKTKFALQLMEIIKSGDDIIASRASVSIWDFLDERSFPMYLDLYPVKVGSANKNIMALAMLKFKDGTKRKLKSKLKEYHLVWGKRRKFLKRFKKYKKGKKTGMDVFMLAPVYEEIPNLNDVDQRAG